ncbi:hypothetical protein QUB80_30590 [Chlorogloeopsis sp. ULAP01]|uniref:hypothetical protein n=1 Tax=Chlorogloeopsis sp. ULAP01 TaxID=3056483 RepID=UPI0025AB3C1C|nr:hypothetical protein [Chlorogloeopsis sp. ULAP01]MDM9385009.1 hypothetical protein [Chlorogloeopsis sp. ULAP01]
MTIMKIIANQKLDKDKLITALQAFRNAKEEFLKVKRLANNEHLALVKKADKYIQYIDQYINLIDTALKKE